MKDILVIFSYRQYKNFNPDYKQHIALLNEVEDTGTMRFLYGALSEMTYIYDGKDFRVIEPVSGRDIASFDLVFFQKWTRLPQHAFAAALHVQHAGVPILRSEVVRQIPSSKIGELPMLVHGGLPIPKTVVAPRETIRAMARDGSLPFTYPFIMKDIGASRGNNNFLVKDDEDFVAKISPVDEDVTFMAQEFIPNDCDYRFAVADGKILYIMRRWRSGDTHLNNTSQGGSAEFMEADAFSDEVIDVVFRAAEATGRPDIAGVDIILTDGGKPYVLEVNSTPQIQDGFNGPHKTKIVVRHIAERLKAAERKSKKKVS